MADNKTTTAMLILDGWGHREESRANALLAADTPTWDRLLREYPHTLVNTSGLAVGLPDGQMGNSEVGHMNIGLGRVVYQNLTRISTDIASGAFYSNPVLTKVVQAAVDKGKAVHILGLLSPGGVHSHEDQIEAAAVLASKLGCTAVYVHAFLDGRDTPPRSALNSLRRMEEKLESLGCGRIASIIGRYYAMDRDNRWDRVSKAYHLLTLGEADFEAESPEAGLDAAYARGEDDEFVQATRILPEQGSTAVIEDGDAVLFMNFRADRARELTRAFVEPGFDHFDRKAVPDMAGFVMLTEYAEDIDTPCAYPREVLTNGLGEHLSRLDLTQLRIAETEKYAHVTFFFSGGEEKEYPGEDRTLIPSPDVATYDLKPEMSAPEVTEALIKAINDRKYDFIVCNYANGDMVGHTGKFKAAVKAAEAVDQCLKQVTDALLANGGQCLITADHGNFELMEDEVTGEAHTAHTNGPVPLVYVGNQPLSLSAGGALCDLAPTILALMNQPQPAEMTGHNLANKTS